MNMEKNTNNITSEELLPISVSDDPETYEERNAPLLIENKKVFNEFPIEEQDFCSDDSVKDPDYENISDSTNSETNANPHFTTQRQKRYSKTKKVPNKKFTFDIRKPLQLLQNESDYVSETTLQTADSNLNRQSDCNIPGVAAQTSSIAIEIDSNIGQNQSYLATTTLKSSQQRSSSRMSSSASSSDSSSSSSDTSNSSSSSSDSEPESRDVAGVIVPDPMVEKNTSVCLSSEIALSNQVLETSFNSAVNVRPLLDTTDPHNSADLPPPSNTTKFTRKRKLNPEKWLCVQAKILRNRGREYTSKSGKIVPEKSMKPPCGEKCKQKCTNKITETQRKEIFDTYWSLGDLQRQREFILRHTSIIKPRYSYKVHNSNRGNNNAFYLSVDGERIRVCKQFFKATLAISDRPIRTVFEKSQPSGSMELDKRGKHNNHHAIDPAIKEGVKRHLDSIPKIESHYCRADSKRVYIDGGKTVADLHRDYVAECQSKGLPSANYIMYYNIFSYEYNISFYQPKKDQCEDCTAYANSTEEEKNRLKEKYEKHLKEKTLSRQSKDDDKNHTADNTIVCVYDLQAAMSCPKGEMLLVLFGTKAKQKEGLLRSGLASWNTLKI
ncbi:unnamed protein product [Colias eurytheme]|nr:unnamed protein product [Colias eurytheme]